jgi:hypothetical protein
LILSRHPLTLTFGLIAIRILRLVAVALVTLALRALALVTLALVLVLIHMRDPPASD